jgi:hypothetical protein
MLIFIFDPENSLFVYIQLSNVQFICLVITYVTFIDLL